MHKGTIGPRTSFALGVAMLGVALASACHPPLPWWKRGFSGRVVDAATGAPVSDAVVVAIWCAEYVRMDGGENFLWAHEAVTDHEGRFSIWPRPAVVFNPFYWPEAPELVTFRPGYRECERGDEARNPDCRPPEIRLAKLDVRGRAAAEESYGGIRHDLHPASASWWKDWMPRFCIQLPAWQLPRLDALVQAEQALFGRKYYGDPSPEDEIARLWRLVLDRGPRQNPPPLPSPAEVAQMTARLRRQIGDMKGLEYLGPGSPGPRWRFAAGDDPPIELGPGDTLPNGATLLHDAGHGVALRLCAEADLVVALALHGRDTPCVYQTVERRGR